ncbi:MAG: cyclic nucleotide-binding domain-containing protein [Saprospiraceae bacterium]|nr:cyclic nucleotide-binding domain-containing protein [Saprospiraceae bacterium]
MISLTNYSAKINTLKCFPGLEDVKQEHVYLKSIEEKEILLKKGHLSKHIFFVNKGLIKLNTYQNNKKKVEKFILEGSIAADLDSLLYGSPSEISFEASAGTEVLVLDIKTFNDLAKKIPNFKNKFILYIKKLDKSRNHDLNYLLLMALYKNLEN